MHRGQTIAGTRGRLERRGGGRLPGSVSPSPSWCEGVGAGRDLLSGASCLGVEGVSRVVLEENRAPVRAEWGGKGAAPPEVRSEWMLATKALRTWGASCRPRGGAGRWSLLLRLGGKETARTRAHPRGRRGVSPGRAGSGPPPMSAHPWGLHTLRELVLGWRRGWCGVGVGGGRGPVCPASLPSQALKEGGRLVRVFRL